MIMIKVIKAKPNEDFTLDLKFSDGCSKRFDMKPYQKFPVFQRLRDVDYFKEISLVFGTVQWKDKQDISPETLYLEGVDISEESDQ